MSELTADAGSALENLRARLRTTPLHLAWRYGISVVGALANGRVLRDVETYCLFVGHPRSGHSVVGALLDAHPQIVISDELDALRYVEAGFRRRQILYLSLRVARHQAARQRRKLGRTGTYSYWVPDGAQGRTRDLRVVGDSRAGWSVRRLTADPALLSRVDDLMAPSAVRFIHVVRNPFDNISTMVIRGRRTLEAATQRYFANCSALVELRRRIGDERLLTIRHEDLIADARGELGRATAFLGISAGQRYLDACAAIVYPQPSRTRESVPWSPPAIAEVRARIDDYAFLAGYAFDG